MSVYQRIYGDLAEKRVSAVSTVYATARASTAAGASGFTTLNIGQGFSSPNYTIVQYTPVFDTSTVSTAAVSAVLSFNCTIAASTGGDTLEVREVASAANKIAGDSLATYTLYGSIAMPASTGRKNITLSSIGGLSRISALPLLIHSQKERLNTAPVANTEAAQLNTAAVTGTTNDPYLDILGGWSFVGVGTNVVATATPLTLTEPAGVADGDLLVACIASRSTATTAVTNTGWSQVNFQATNNTLTTGSAIASGTMLYRIRSGAPDLTFDLPAGISVAMGQIVAYRGSAQTTPLDVSTAVTAAAGTAVSVTGLTTTQDDDLIVAMAAGGQEAAWSAFTNVTTPLTASGATNTTTAPSTTAWIERADNLTTSGADTSLGIFDAVRTGTGATGNLTATASVSAGHVVIAGAFKILPTPTADAWNANDKSANLSLSNSDKTVASTSAASGGVRSTQTHLNGAAGKYYAEFFFDVAGGLARIGIEPSSNPLTATTVLTMTVTSAAGVVSINAITSGTALGAYGLNDVVSIAWDAGAELIWFRLNANNWNNTVGHDPATGTGGLDCSFAAAENHALFAQAAVSGRGVTLRTELAEFTQAVPSGFTSWMGETPSVSEVTGTGGATLGLTAAASGVEGVTSTAAATIALSGAASGVHGASGDAAATLTLSAAAIGEFEEAGAATGLVGVWTGSAWMQKPAKVWMGSAWMQKPVKTWNGSAWV